MYYSIAAFCADACGGLDLDLTANYTFAEIDFVVRRAFLRSSQDEVGPQDVRTDPHVPLTTRTIILACSCDSAHIYIYIYIS